MGFDGFYTQYTPDLNVGIENLILGETTINSKNIISGFELSKIQKTNNYFYMGISGYVEYYPKDYDKSVFKRIPLLKFDTQDNSLTHILCIINNNYQSAVFDGLISKYGYNRNYEWKIKGIYRTEINNKYGNINILLHECDNYDKPDNIHINVGSTIVKELTLEMSITKLKSTKMQMEKEKEVDDIKKQTDFEKIELEKRNRLKIGKLFNFD